MSFRASRASNRSVNSVERAAARKLTTISSDVGATRAGRVVAGGDTPYERSYERAYAYARRCALVYYTHYRQHIVGLIVPARAGRAPRAAGMVSDVSRASECRLSVRASPVSSNGSIIHATENRFTTRTTHRRSPQPASSRPAPAHKETKSRADQ